MLAQICYLSQSVIHTLAKMNRLTAAAIIAASIVLAPRFASAQAASPVTAQLIELNATLQIATKNHDTATLSRLITNDYELVSSSGKVYDKRAFLADAADPSVVYETNQPEDVSVRNYGDCAIVTAVLHVRYRIKRTLVDTRIRYGDLWVKRDGVWRYAYGEASPIKRPCRPACA
jgi:ketosteroid isomerase-like protein